MRKVLIGLVILISACVHLPQIETATGGAKTQVGNRESQWTSMRLPVYDHVVVVVEENKDYEQIIDNPAAEYINKTLRAEGATLTEMFAEEHYSEGNYFWLLSGSNQNVGFIDEIPRYTFDAENLAHQLLAQKLSFKGYSEDLPEIGSIVEREGLYARKHVPWISFSNIPNGKISDQSSNLRFVDFPLNFDLLPTVAIVVPNLVNDMHDGPLPASVKAGDKWLNDKLNAYYLWAKSHNSLLIVTFDENDHGRALGGLTDPAASKRFDRNRIVTILAGAHIRHGEYAEGTGVTHVNLLRTLEAMYGLAKCGRQQELALKAGIEDDKVISDVFESIDLQ
jgi:phosphatidylinositol-3-phosphatase